MLVKLLIRVILVILVILGFAGGVYSTNSSRLLNHDSAPTGYCSFQLELIRFVGFPIPNSKAKLAFLFNLNVYL